MANFGDSFSNAFTNTFSAVSAAKDRREQLAMQKERFAWDKATQESVARQRNTVLTAGNVAGPDTSGYISDADYQASLTGQPTPSTASETKGLPTALPVPAPVIGSAPPPPVVSAPPPPPAVSAPVMGSAPPPPVVASPPPPPVLNTPFNPTTPTTAQTQEEQNVIDYSRNHFQQGTYQRNPDGSVTSFKGAIVGDPGNYQLIPTYWNGQVVDAKTAAGLAAKSGTKFPTYQTLDQANAAEGRLHTVMDQDSRMAPPPPVGGPNPQGLPTGAPPPPAAGAPSPGPVHHVPVMVGDKLMWAPAGQVTRLSGTARIRAQADAVGGFDPTMGAALQDAADQLESKNIGLVAERIDAGVSAARTVAAVDPNRGLAQLADFLNKNVPGPGQIGLQYQTDGSVLVQHMAKTEKGVVSMGPPQALPAVDPNTGVSAVDAVFLNAGSLGNAKGLEDSVKLQGDLATQVLARAAEKHTMSYQDASLTEDKKQHGIQNSFEGQRLANERRNTDIAAGARADARQLAATNRAQARFDGYLKTANLDPSSKTYGSDYDVAAGNIYKEHPDLAMQLGVGDPSKDVTHFTTPSPTAGGTPARTALPPTTRGLYSSADPDRIFGSAVKNGVRVFGSAVKNGVRAGTSGGAASTVARGTPGNPDATSAYFKR